MLRRSGSSVGSRADISHALALNREAMLKWERRMSAARKARTRELPGWGQKWFGAPTEADRIALSAVREPNSQVRAAQREHDSTLALPRHPSATAAKFGFSEKRAFSRSSERFTQ